MALQITVGAGLTRPEGRRLDVAGVDDLAEALRRQPPATEAWWAPHLWRGDVRDSEAWESACAIGVDLDQDGHRPLPPELAAQLDQLALEGGLPGSIFHRTPAGARVVFVLDAPCADCAAFERAAEGAAQAVTDCLRELDVAGVAVDPKPHRDLARLYFTPNSIAKGVRRQADVLVMRRQPYAVQELAELRQPEAPIPIRPAPPQTTGDAARRAAAYIAAMGYSVAGNRGDDHAFRVAAVLVNDFALPDDQALDLLTGWNARCQPPWPERDLLRFLRSAAKNAKRPAGEKLREERPAQAPAGAPDAPPDGPRGIPLVRACDAVERPVQWVVEGLLARGELTDLSGDPGVGKGGITASWAARVTREDPAASVIFFATEDPLGRVKARLRAEGADLSRVLLLDITRPDAAPVLPGDVAAVEALVREHRAALLILDPALEFMEAGLDSHKQQDVARFMAPLLGVAMRTGAALLTVRHLNKGGGAKGGGSALYRASGSIGFTGKARIALLASRDAETGARALATTKNNLGRDRYTVGYDVVSRGDASVIAWGEVLATSADELVNQEPGKKHGPPPARQEAAQDVLADILSKGPMHINDAVRCAKSEGISRGTLYRAAAALRVEKITLQMKAAWRLPLSGNLDSGNDLTGSPT